MWKCRIEEVYVWKRKKIKFSIKLMFVFILNLGKGGEILEWRVLLN